MGTMRKKGQDPVRAAVVEVVADVFRLESEEAGRREGITTKPFFWREVRYSEGIAVDRSIWADLWVVCDCWIKRNRQ